MVGFVAFLSFCVSIAVVWVVIMGRYVLSIGGISGLLNGSAVQIGMVLMSFFLPILMVACALGFLYLFLEMKKNQLIFKDWLSSIKKDLEEKERGVHSLVGEQLRQTIEQDEGKDTDTYPLPFEEEKVMTISKKDTLAKYQNLELPEGVDLRFKG